MPLKRRRIALPVAFLLALLTIVSATPFVGGQSAFVRGEFNQDGRLDISDVVSILIHLFVEGRKVFVEGRKAPCLSAGDVNDDRGVDVSDAVWLLGYLFQAGKPPPAPFPDCGVDPTPDSLGCDESPPCAGRHADPEIAEWRVPWPSSRPRDPYVDDQGRVWFVGQNADYAAYLEPATGEFTRFDLGAGAGPHNIIVGEFAWYAGNRARHIGKLDRETGEITRFSMPNAAARDPHTLVFDRRGDIWFTVQNGNFVGKLATETGEVILLPVPTPSSRPYGIVMDSADRPWFVEFGTNKLGTVDTGAMAIEEFTIPQSGARPRRLGVTSDDTVWYVDHGRGFLGRFLPATREFSEWRMPGGSGSRPYGMAVDDRDRIWFVETGRSPNRFIGFDPLAEEFFSVVAIPSGGGSVRHMYFHPATREIWFGTDVNTVGRARLDPVVP